MKRTVGAVIVSVLLSSVLFTGASVLAAAKESSHLKKSAPLALVHKKLKHKGARIHKRSTAMRSKAIHNAQKREKHIAHMRGHLKKVARHTHHAKTGKLASR